VPILGETKPYTKELEYIIHILFSVILQTDLPVLKLSESGVSLSYGGDSILKIPVCSLSNKSMLFYYSLTMHRVDDNLCSILGERDVPVLETPDYNAERPLYSAPIK
jgi:hypothetical protein